MVNIGKDAKLQILKESGRTTVAVIPVKVRARVIGRSVVTNTYLDNGSYSSLCTESLMKQLEVNGQQTKISLSTLEKKNSAMKNFLVRDLLIFDLDENEWISFPMLYTAAAIFKLKRTLISGLTCRVSPPHVRAEVGLLIASDVP